MTLTYEQMEEILAGSSLDLAKGVDITTLQTAIQVALALQTTNADTFFTAWEDASTEKQTIVDYTHHEIHDGSAFMLHQISDVDALDIAAPLTYRMRTVNSNKHIHMFVEADVAAAAVIEIFEDNGIGGHYVVSGGTKVIPKNRNRNYKSTKASVCNVQYGVTVGAASLNCRIYGKRLGGFKQSGDSGFRNELVLEAGGDYLFRLTSDADNNEGSLNLEWYEHTDRSM